MVVSQEASGKIDGKNRRKFAAKKRKQGLPERSGVKELQRARFAHSISKVT